MSLRSISSAALAAALISGCTVLGPRQPEDTAPPAPPQEVADTALPQAGEAAIAPGAVLTAAPVPPAAAITQESLDTTTDQQRASAAAAPQTPVQMLGTTVASLGSPTEPGFWLKTPLVQTETSGRVTNKANGKSSAVRLIPIDGPATAGSRISLPAMRLIEAPVTELVDLDVSLGG